MRISISNIAWHQGQDAEIASLLNEFSIDAIDVAHSKYFADPKVASKSEVIKVRNWWDKKGIEIVGMQALMFGTSGLNLFGSRLIRTKMLNHLHEICRIANQLGARFLVFGSPKCRDLAECNKNDAVTYAKEFFEKLGDIALKNSVTICLEPNPKIYGANFLTATEETFDFVDSLSHEGIKLQFDTGTLITNNEDPKLILDKCKEHVSHIHISEPNLVEVGSLNSDHESISKAIKQTIGEKTCTIEMVASQCKDPINSVKNALRFTSEHYR
jgi:sugar phosphate isomerase/epimerase